MNNNQKHCPVTNYLQKNKTLATGKGDRSFVQHRKNTIQDKNGQGNQEKMSKKQGIRDEKIQEAGTHKNTG